MLENSRRNPELVSSKFKVHVHLRPLVISQDCTSQSGASLSSAIHTAIEADIELRGGGLEGYKYVQWSLLFLHVRILT